MDGYIKKSEAVDVIVKYPYDIAGKTATAIKMIEDLPSADVVEVVRCKDCVHWGGVTYGFVCRKLSGIDTTIFMGADRFCSYGERRE